MANFYRDCDDLRHRIARVDWGRIVPLWERKFRDVGEYEMAPENVEEACETNDMVLDMVGEFAAEEVAPHAEAVDRQGCSLIDGEVHYADATKDQMQKLAELGLMGFTLPRRFGGMNLPSSMFTATAELIGRADASLQNLYGLQGCGETINFFASEELKQEYLPRICAGELTCAMVLTEPNAGSDLPAVSTRATLVDEEKGLWSVSGQKCFITNGGADVLLVLARTEEGTDDARGLSLILVPKSERTEVPKIEDKLGIHGSPTCVINLNEAEGYLVGKRRRGLATYVLSLLHAARLGVSAQAIGVAQAALTQGIQYSRLRSQFGKTIDRFGRVRELILDSEARVQAARILVYKTAEVVDIKEGTDWCLEEGVFGEDELADRKEDAKRYRRLENLLTPLAKYYSTETANKVAYDMLQVHGGYGFMREYPAERFARDARITNIYEGTSQIQAIGVVNLIVRGGVPDLFDEIRAAASAPEGMGDLMDILEDGYASLERSIGYLAEMNDASYIRLVAESVACLVIDLYCGYMLLEESGASPRRAIVARHFIEGGQGRMLADSNRILNGSRQALDAYDEVVADSYL
jgi:alkylation response protein AidB-like acyl-CoA dehydrogenase